MYSQGFAVLLPGTVFHGRYHVVRCIKMGGMGAIYEVIDDKTASRRALKVMLPGLVESPEMCARFSLEARITGNIESDHIVRVSDAGVDDALGMPFLVMELLRGDELGSLLARRKVLSSDEVVIYLHQASLALDRTHAAGIIHRDLKPENLFLTHRDDGSPCIKILDFGIAKVLEQGERTQGTRSMGTPVYMAPEQARGEGGLIGPPTDIYSLAHIAYKLLAGEAYWASELRRSSSLISFFATVARGVREPASKRARKRGVELPSAFDGWFRKAAAPSPEDRFGRATSAVTALAEALGVDVPMPPLHDVESGVVGAGAGLGVAIAPPEATRGAGASRFGLNVTVPAEGTADTLTAGVSGRARGAGGSSTRSERSSMVAYGEATAAGRAPVGSALHQLRAPPADFTGRGEELADLRARLGPGGAIIAGLTGQGGVGKTALALKLAHALTRDYPDAQIDIDLGGSGASPLTSAQVMERVIHAFEPAERLPKSDAELSARYRSVLHGKRALLLLDNARDRDQVEPLAPPAGCLLLVTSRQHFTLPGLYARRLGVLDAGEAVTLVKSIVPHLDQPAAGELAELCGYLPLALRAAASTLADRVDMKPARFIERLHGAQERLKLVESVLASNLDLLDAPARGLWIALGVFPAMFDAAAAAAVGDVSFHEACDQLGELVRRSLLEWDGSTERYRMHDLAREYARSRLTADEQYACERRHAVHFLEVARSAGELYEKGGDALMEGLGAFDRDQSHIAAAQAWAAANAERDEAAARVCCELSMSARSVLAMRQPPRERIVWNEAALAAARLLGRRSEEGQILGSLGLAYADLGDVRKAIELYKQHLAVARDVGDRNSEGRAVGNLGLAHADLGEVHTALDLFERHIAITRELGDRRSEGRALGNLGGAHYRLGDARKAIELYKQNLAIARELGDRNGEGSALGNLGAAYADLGEMQRAIELFEKHLMIARELGDRKGEGRALGNLGLGHIELGDAHKAVELFEQHLAITRELGDRQGEAIASWNLGLAYEKLGDLLRAVDAMQVRVEFERLIEHPDFGVDEAYVKLLRAQVEQQGGVGLLRRFRAWLRNDQR